MVRRLLGGESTFVLGASGHIAGVINPAGKNKRSYWTGESASATAEEWWNTAEEHKGSWWWHWIEWLKSRSGKEVAARVKLGNASYRPSEPAPGRYVKERA
jgi:polyhydroxyalkanoate synthase